MNMYHLKIKRGTRGEAVRHARYISREGTYSRQNDLVAAGYGNLPASFDDNPSNFWDAADRFERANGPAYRELIIAISNEFTNAECVALVSKIIHSMLGEKVYQFAIHRSDATLGKVPNTHIHLMYSDRLPDEHWRSPEQTFRRYNSQHPAIGGCKKDSGGRTPLQLRDEVIAKRALVANIQNEMLREMGATTRVDHRSHRERGIEDQPERHLGQRRIRSMQVHERADYVARRNGK